MRNWLTVCSPMRCPWVHLPSSFVGLLGCSLGNSAGGGAAFVRRKCAGESASGESYRPTVRLKL